MKAITGILMTGSFACWRKSLTTMFLVLFLFTSSFGQFSGLSAESPSSLGKRGFEVDLKVFYFRHIRSELNDGFNVAQLILKVSNKKDRFCFYLPFGIFQEMITYEYDHKENLLLYFISPRISGDIFRTRQFEIWTGAYSEIIFSEEDPVIPLIGITAGIGIQDRSRRVFFRTEFGFDLITTCFGESIWNFSCSVGYNILSPKKKYRSITMNKNLFLTSMNRAKNLRR